VPGETRSPRQTSGVRFGTPAATTRGMTEEQVRQVGRIVAKIAEDPDDQARLAEAHTTVRAIADSLERI
jgi:glycine hydroxymethyltransferase